MFLPPYFFGDIAAQSLGQEAHRRILKTRGIETLFDPNVKIYFIMGVPGSGTCIMARFLFESGQFDACLIEPASQFTCPPRQRLSKTFGKYVKAVKKARQGKSRNAQVRLLVVEKPLLWAPGEENEEGLYAHIAEGQICMVRSPRHMMGKRLEICRAIIQEHWSRASGHRSLIYPGQDPILDRKLSNCEAGEPIVDTVCRHWKDTYDFRALTKESWLFQQRIYEGLPVRDAISLASSRYAHDVAQWARDAFWGESAPKYDSLEGGRGCYHTEMLERPLGWRALKDYYEFLISETPSGFGPKTRRMRVVDFDRFSGSVAPHVRHILSEWDVPERPSRIDWRQGFHVLPPYGRVPHPGESGDMVLTVAYGKAIWGESQMAVDNNAARLVLPDFLERMIPLQTVIYNGLVEGALSP